MFVEVFTSVKFGVFSGFNRSEVRFCVYCTIYKWY